MKAKALSNVSAVSDETSRAKNLRAVERAALKALGPIRVLLVEDSPPEMVKLCLKVEAVSLPNLTILQAVSLRDALMVMDSESIDLCICDFELNGGNAADLFQASRNRNFSFPFVAITGNATESELATRLLSIGFDDVVLKSDLPNANLLRVIRNALLRARHVQALVDKAMFDELTQVLNRRGILMRMRVEKERSRRLRLPISLIFVDVDKFKQLNDVHGHHIGDQALRQLGSVIRHTVQPSDIVGRMGGDEFVIISPGASAVIVKILTSRVEQAVRNNPIEVEGRIVSLSVSLGGTTHLPSDPELEIEDLLALADAQMYQHKRTGQRDAQQERRARRKAAS
tara:strand:+ start:5611 stop:6636 length:1026 start_codon:yes stop_codon:yes gene_type:complete